MEETYGERASREAIEAIGSNTKRRAWSRCMDMVVRWISRLSVEFIGICLILTSGMEMKDQMNGDSEHGLLLVAITGTLGFIIVRAPTKYFK